VYRTPWSNKYDEKYLSGITEETRRLVIS
jgi:hypothetical protein